MLDKIKIFFIGEKYTILVLIVASVAMSIFVFSGFSITLTIQQ